MGISYTDSYDLFAVTFANVMFGYVFYSTADKNPNELPGPSDTAIKVASSVGTIIGQIIFGLLNDIYGRRKVHPNKGFLMFRCTALK